MARAKIIDDLLRILRPEIAGGRGDLWTLARVQSVLGPNVSLDTCRGVMRRLEALGEVRPVDMDCWRRRS